MKAKRRRQDAARAPGRSHDPSSLRPSPSPPRRRLAAPAAAADAAAGKAVYDAAKPACKGCHTDAKSPLTRTGADNTADELKAWIRTPKDMIAKRGKKGIMPAYPRRRSPTRTSRTSWPTSPR
jgi:mono/diheme cytochrome c family protein